MSVLVKFVGIVVAGVGIIFLLNPKKMKQFMAFWGKGKRLYTAGVLRILLGVIFLLAASQCKLSVVIAILGILFLIGGILIFSLGLQRTKFILGWWNRRSLLVLRLVNLVIIALGALIYYSV